MQADKILEGLNSRQIQAIKYNNGPLLVIAGPGTGKTTVITKKIAYLIMEKLAKPEEILALTFTQKAAREMEERVDILLPYGYNDVNVRTFHSFAEDFLREHAYLLGFSTNFKILTQPGQILFIKDHIFDFGLKIFRPLSDPSYFIQDLIKIFSRAKDELVTPEEYIDFVEKVKEKTVGARCAAPLLHNSPKKQNSKAEQDEYIGQQLEIAKAYKTYQELLIQADRMDFGDLVMYMIEALKKHSYLLNKIKNQYKYILVDEFQDTNWAQNELLKVLTLPVENADLHSLPKDPKDLKNPKDLTITVVGDDDQSIYKFRGAAVSNILNFKENWPNIKEVVLNENYRNTQEILDSSYQVIQNNNPDRLEFRYKINKKLIADVKDTETGCHAPELLYYDTETQEAEKIAEKIIKLKNNPKNPKDSKDPNDPPLKWSDFAILVRSNNQAIPFINALSSKKIPFVFSGAEGLFRKKVIKDLISFLSILTNPADNLALFNLFISEIFAVDFDKISIVLHKVRSLNVFLEEYLRSSLNNPQEKEKLEENLGKENLEKIEKILDILQELRRESIKRSTGELIYRFLQMSGYLKRLASEEKKGSVEAAEKIIAIASFFDKVTVFENNNLQADIQKFMEYLNILLEIGEEKEEEVDFNFDAVRVLTIHKAKGLEFDYVFMVGMVDSRIPGRKKNNLLELPDALIKEKLPEGDSHIQEERRLFYVGMTRARRFLYFTAARDYGGKKTSKLSRFVVEAVGEENIAEEMVKPVPLERIEQFYPKDDLLYSSRLRVKDNSIRLSRAEVDDWLTCPRKYKFIHITPIRLLADPRITFGRAIHKVIEEFYKSKLSLIINPKDPKDLKDLKDPYALNQLLEIYKQNWSSEGFLSPEHEKRRFEEGISIIKKFYYEYSKLFNVIEVEKKFKFEISCESSQISANSREYQNKTDYNIIVEGRIDIIEKLSGGGTRIIDFKTSDVDNKEKAERRARDSIQLAIYALAMQEIEGEVPEEIGLFFLGSGILGLIRPTEKLIKDAQEKIIKVARGIRAQHFQATPDKIKCEQCPYSRYCDDSAI